MHSKVGVTWEGACLSVQPRNKDNWQRGWSNCKRGKSQKVKIPKGDSSSLSSGFAPASLHWPVLCGSRIYMVYGHADPTHVLELGTKTDAGLDCANMDWIVQTWNGFNSSSAGYTAGILPQKVHRRRKDLGSPRIWFHANKYHSFSHLSLRKSLFS